MRDPNLPADLRVEMAKSAAPFVHVKPKGSSGSAIASTSRVRFRDANSPSNSSTDKMETTLTDVGPETTSSANLLPLDYLLSVMKDADAAPWLRTKAARIAAPYRHGYPTGWVEPSLVIEDQFGFEVDVAMAKQIRDDVDRMRELWFFGKRTCIRFPKELAAKKEVTEIEARKAKWEETVKCPSGYTSREADMDRVRLRELADKQKSMKKLTPQETAEQAHLRARTLVYETSIRPKRDPKWKRLSVREAMDEYRRERARRAQSGDTTSLLPAWMQEFERNRARRTQSGARKQARADRSDNDSDNDGSG